MMEHSIYITTADGEKLRELIREVKYTTYGDKGYLTRLARELDRATVVEPGQIPSDVITMNAQALLVDADTGEELRYTLVFPEEADVPQGKISVLAPIGTAMLGYRVGDTFVWETPGGTRTLQVVRILFQPEAEGEQS